MKTAKTFKILAFSTLANFKKKKVAFKDSDFLDASDLESVTICANTMRDSYALVVVVDNKGKIVKKINGI